MTIFYNWTPLFLISSFRSKTVTKRATLSNSTLNRFSDFFSIIWMQEVIFSIFFLINLNLFIKLSNFQKKILTKAYVFLFVFSPIFRFKWPPWIDLLNQLLSWLPQWNSKDLIFSHCFVIKFFFHGSHNKDFFTRFACKIPAQTRPTFRSASWCCLFSCAAPTSSVPTTR